MTIDWPTSCEANASLRNVGAVAMFIGTPFALGSPTPWQKGIGALLIGGGFVLVGSSTLNLVLFC